MGEVKAIQDLTAAIKAQLEETKKLLEAIADLRNSLMEAKPAKKATRLGRPKSED